MRVTCSYLCHRHVVLSCPCLGGSPVRPVGPAELSAGRSSLVHCEGGQCGVGGCLVPYLNVLNVPATAPPPSLAGIVEPAFSATKPEAAMAAESSPWHTRSSHPALSCLWLLCGLCCCRTRSTPWPWSSQGALCRRRCTRSEPPAPLPTMSLREMSRAGHVGEPLVRLADHCLVDGHGAAVMCRCECPRRRTEGVEDLRCRRVSPIHHLVQEQVRRCEPTDGLAVDGVVVGQVVHARVGPFPARIVRPSR